MEHVLRSWQIAARLAGLAVLGFFVGRAGRDGSATQRVRAAAALLADGGNRVVRRTQSHCVTAFSY